MGLGAAIPFIKGLAPKPIDPADVGTAVAAYLEEHPEATCPIDDTAGEGDTGKVWSADKTAGEVATLSEAIAYKTPEEFGAKGDGTTDDSEAVQDAVDAGYAVRFGDNKTYYLESAVTIDHDVHLIGGKNTVIKTKTPSGGTVNNGIVVSGTLKKTTTLTTDYSSTGSTANAGNQFTLSDMTGISIGDILLITATDQFYNYSRAYYYLGGTLLIGDIYDDHLYTTNSLPFDIENTENVSVKIYSAPQVIIENIDFVSDLDSRGSYIYCITLERCKNSTVRNCNISNMDNGILINNCVNTLIDCVSVAKSKYSNSLSGDSYGIAVYSSSETIIQRIESIDAQSCVVLSGTIPNMNTYIRNCNLASECRQNSIGSHENAYNTVVEDCVLTNLNVLGTAEVRRCRFIKNNRVSVNTGISFCGSHNPAWATLKVSNCTFDAENATIYISASATQSPIQQYDNIVGLIELNDCTGGMFIFYKNGDQGILSNTIKELRFNRWINCYEVYLPYSDCLIEKLSSVDCTYKKAYWVNDHNDQHGVVLSSIMELDYRTTFPMDHKVSVNKDTNGEKYTLPENVKINLSSTNTSAKYVVCGNNLAPNEPDDWVVGIVSGSDGGSLTREAGTGNIPTVSKDSDGNIVYKSPEYSSATYNLYPVGMFYVPESGKIKMSAKLKNTGGTSAASFIPYIAIVDCATGKLISRYSGSATQATADGASVSYEHSCNANCIAMCYWYNNTAYTAAETTIADFIAYFEASFAPVTADSIQPYEAKRRTGDGSILSLAGANNIMCSDFNFHVQFVADYVENPIGVLPSGTGVNF